MEVVDRPCLEIARVLTGLKELRHLQRGDFLAEVVEHINLNFDSLKVPKLNIEEFWASEDYYFHTREQMLAVAKWCPKISKAMFMFEAESCDDLSILGEFPLLSDLDLWGGRFYRDGLSEYLQSYGNNLIKYAQLQCANNTFSWAQPVLTARVKVSFGTTEANNGCLKNSMFLFNTGKYCTL